MENLKLIANSQDLPLGALIVSELINSSKKVKITIELIKEWKKPTNIELSNGKETLADWETSVARILSQQLAPELAGGDSCLEKCQVDSWISFSNGQLANKELSENALVFLNKTLSTITYLVGKRLTLADIYVFSKIYKMEINEKYDHIKRWSKQIFSLPEVKKYTGSASTDKNNSKTKKPATAKKDGPGKKEQGQFIDLPGAEMGKVVVRFPPEASGYLHIGHAKAALLNQHYAQAYKGKLIMRFDDTNPAKENVEFEQAILEDLKLLEIKPDRFTHSSDYFELMLEYCEKLIKEGKAYADDTPADIMRDQREKKEPSANRDNSVDKNIKMWNEMKAGSEKGQQCCIRAKMFYDSLNGAMRDPTIYRCKPEPHPRTGTKYNVYPTYDFACPIVDSIEDVTLTLRTTEYLDRDDQFYWFIDALGLRRPHIWAYSRLNMTNTVLSKRKLTWFVNEGLVDGWDDPRFPTVRGIVRRGMTVEGLKQFIIAQGSSRSVVFMEWDKIWAFNKKVIDPIAIRYTALNNNELVSVKIDGASEDTLTVQNHPKDPSIGTKKIKVGANILIERTDAETLVEGNNATFVHWGNILIQKINKKNGVITSVDGKLNLDNKDYKNTVKLTWLIDDRSNASSSDKSVPCYAVYFDHIISKAVLGKDDDFKDFVGKETRKEVKLMGESELTRVKKGEIIQLQRKGFFRCDVPYMPASGFTSCEQPLVLFHIPDGHATASAASKKTETKTSVTSVNKESSPSDLSADELSSKIAAQGEKIRQLKADKAEKAVITPEVNLLLKLKSDYKSVTGQEWKPSPVTASSNNSADDILSKIADQGEKVRQLKSVKADKAVVLEAVGVLLKLKDEYKKVTGQDWKPQAVKKETSSSTTSEKQVTSSNNQASSVESDLSKKVETQGNKVRELKSAKADKATVTEAVGVLLKLKEEYKKATGQEWKPPAVTKETPSSSTTSDKQMASTNNQASSLDNDLSKKIETQGNKVRELKSAKADKATVLEAVGVLLKLKEEYKKATGQEWKPTNAGATTDAKSSNSNTKAKSSEKQQQKKEKPKVQAEKKDDSSKTGTRLGLEAKKLEDFSNWFSQVLVKSEMMDYYDVSGCYVIRPWSYSIWDIIKDFFDGEIKKLGVKNCSFPMFVSKSALEREKDHIADFAPEVAWVTKSGDSDLAEPIAIRPTSETVMYPSYAKWIKSHRDLPLKLNQWNSVVRWEFKHPQPFLRTREFLWQEGHTAFLTKQEADEEVLQILELYARIYEEYLAIPVVRGRKSEKEKFAGGDYTTTVEAFIPACGRAIQGATSHHLGQNFARMFGIQVEGAEEGSGKSYVYQNSWGITTRTIGVMVMVHGDDKGLVLPPKIAETQAVIVPCGITATTSPEQRKKLMDECSKLENELKKDNKLRVEGDYRDNYSPGWKFSHWELKGVPIRVELGFKDLEKNQVTLVRRDNGEKLTANRINILDTILQTLDKIQDSMLAKAKRELDQHTIQTNEWTEFRKKLDEKNLLLSPFCGEISCEDNIKADSTREESDAGAPSMGAKTLCIPFEQPEIDINKIKCVHPHCTNKAKYFTLFGRSY